MTLAALATLAVAGCQAPPQPTGPTAIVLHVPDYDVFFDATCSTLRRYDFAPQSVDRTQGLIVSQPATSGQWFEFWRVDSRGAYQTAESSLHTMRRIVTVRLEPLGADTQAALRAIELATATTQPAGTDEAPAAPIGGRFRVTVQVDKSRFSAPERQVTTASGALVLYSERTPTVEGLRGPRSRVVRWVPLGRDGLLEDFLLREVAKASPEALADEASHSATPGGAGSP